MGSEWKIRQRIFPAESHEIQLPSKQYMWARLRVEEMAYEQVFDFPFALVPLNYPFTPLELFIIIVPITHAKNSH
jgi:hypothetical protein